MCDQRYLLYDIYFGKKKREGELRDLNISVSTLAACRRPMKASIHP